MPDTFFDRAHHHWQQHAQLWLAQLDAGHHAGCWHAAASSLQHQAQELVQTVAVFNLGSASAPPRAPAKASVKPDGIKEQGKQRHDQQK